MEPPSFITIAFAPKEDLQGGLLNCSVEGFAKAMDISCHSFVRMAKLAAPLFIGDTDDKRLLPVKHWTQLYIVHGGASAAP
jgi:hypothetical protein